MLNVVDEQTTETDQIEVTASDEAENVLLHCEVIDEVDGEQSSSL